MEGSKDMPSVQVQNILDKISSDAGRKAKEIEDKAREEENTILANAKAEGEKIKAEILANAEKKAKAEKDRIVADARVKARKESLKASEEAIEEAFSNSMEKMEKATSTSSYEKTLKRLIQESTTIVGKAKKEIVLTARDKKLITAEDLEGLDNVSVSSEELQGMGGVIVRTEDGIVEIDNTLETRIYREKSEIRKKVAAVLFVKGE